MKLFLFFPILLFYFAATAQTGRKFAQDTVVWASQRPLIKSDFKAKYRQGYATAYTGTGIYLYVKEVEAEPKFFAEAIFLKSKSYMKDSSAYVLKHEQLHFDICELYARKLRQKLNDKDFTKVKNFRENVQKLYDRLSDEMNKEQLWYDADTENGMNAAKQQVWEVDITRRLTELKEFAYTDVDIVK